MRPIHFEILVDDARTAIDFYQSVFEWQIEDWEEGVEQNWLVTTGPEQVPGINGAIMNRHFSQAVINTVEVGSLELTLEKVQAAGGKKVHGPSEIPGVENHAYCADPEANLFGILQPVTKMDNS